MKSILLTTIQQPLGIESESCTPHISAELYHAQITCAQSLFSVRSICTGWGLDFIAANIPAPTTVLHYPTVKRFIRELKKGYDYVGIGFVVCTFPKAKELCALIRHYAPTSKIVLGGYGTVLPECDQYADHVCREEGVNFFRRLLDEEPVDHFTVPTIKKKLKVLSITTRPETIIPTGLGCSRGCDFCCTSHFFDRTYVPLLKTGKEIHEAMCAENYKRLSYRNVGIIDEDFLADRVRINDLIPLNAAEVERPIMFSCLTSLRSIAQYTTEELLMMGLSGVWVGIESQHASYNKLKGLDAHAMLNELKRVGIIPLTSMIIGFDWHTEETVEQDLQYLFSLRPAFSQFMIYTPCPKTPLYQRFIRENRLLGVPYKFVDGFHAMFAHPHLSKERLEEILRHCFEREYEELGPSVCRSLEIQLNGYASLKESPRPLFRARAREHRNLAIEIFPLMKVAIRLAPSQTVRNYLTALRERAMEELAIPRSAFYKERAVPALAFYSRMSDRFFPNSQPPVEVHRYRQ